MTALVVDASVVTAWLTDTGDAGVWATAEVTGSEAASPHLMPAEVASALGK